MCFTTEGRRWMAALIQPYCHWKVHAPLPVRLLFLLRYFLPVGQFAASILQSPVSVPFRLAACTLEFGISFLPRTRTVSGGCDLPSLRTTTNKRTMGLPAAGRAASTGKRHLPTCRNICYPIGIRLPLYGYLSWPSSFSEFLAVLLHPALRDFTRHQSSYSLDLLTQWPFCQ